MPQPGMNGMEPAFGEAYGGHRGLLSPCPMAMSPQGGRTEYDKSVLLMLGSSAPPRKRPFELLSDLVDDGGLGEDQQPERWDVSALDEMTCYARLGLGGAGGELLACSEDAVLMGRWGRSRQEQEQEEEEEEGRRKSRHAEAKAGAEGREEGGPVSVPSATPGEPCLAGRVNGPGQDGGGPRQRTVEVYEVAREEDEEEEEEEEAGSALEQRSEEHNYSLSQGGEPGPGPQPEEQQAAEGRPEERDSEESRANSEVEEEDEEEEEEEEEEGKEEAEEEEEGEEGAEETAAEAELSSSSETECEAEAEPARRPGGGAARQAPLLLGVPTEPGHGRQEEAGRGRALVPVLELQHPAQHAVPPRGEERPAQSAQDGRQRPDPQPPEAAQHRRAAAEAQRRHRRHGPRPRAARRGPGPLPQGEEQAGLQGLPAEKESPARSQQDQAVGAQPGVRQPAGGAAADQRGDQAAGGERRGGRLGPARDDPAPGGHPQRVQRTPGRRTDQRLCPEDPGRQRRQSGPAPGAPPGGRGGRGGGGGRGGRRGGRLKPSSTAPLSGGMSVLPPPRPELLLTSVCVQLAV
ncbi:uncharacterized protein ACNS7B_024156 isoform 1-T2 [Menidia menidia]